MTRLSSVFWVILSELSLLVTLESWSTDFYGNRSSHLQHLRSKFHRLKGGGSEKSTIPVWVITESNVSAVHRFFDSSPISPSGRYIALLLIHGGESIRSTEQELAQIVVYNLQLGPSSKKVIASTTAWDSQTGSHIQWGATDEALFYNIRMIDSMTYAEGCQTRRSNKEFSSTLDIKCKGLRGVAHNIFSGIARMLDCPVYHVSPDGLFAVSPDLTKIRFTQLGYGIPSSTAKRNINAPKNDGVYLTNISTGKCRLLSSLHDLAVAGGLDVKGTPTYGFHTKISSDGKIIMIVVRTLHGEPKKLTERIHGSIFTGGARSKHVFAEKLLSIVTSVFGYSQKSVIRTQHLFVMLRNGSNVRLILSWGGSVVRMNNGANSGSNSTGGSSIRGLFNGNHPNWVPKSHNISMNLVQVHSWKGRNVEQRGIQKSLQLPMQQLLRFQVVTISVDSIMALNSSEHSRRNCGSNDYNLVNMETSMNPHIDIVYPWGSGHPSFHPGGRYLLMDAYPKELKGLRSLSNSVLPETTMNNTKKQGQGTGLALGSAPLRLVDTFTGRERWLLKVRTDFDIHLVTLSQNRWHRIYS